MKLLALQDCGWSGYEPGRRPVNLQMICSRSARDDTIGEEPIPGNASAVKNAVRGISTSSER